MNSGSVWTRRSMVLAAATLCLAFAASTSAQVQTTTTKTSGTPTKEVKIESGEIVAVKGNDLFIRMDDGTLRDFPNVPATAKITADGKKLGIHDLKPGMKLQRTTVTTTTPYVVTTVQTVTGKVWYVAPPITVILTMENGENQQFKIPEGQKFMVDGRETDAWGLKKGMIVTATKIVEEPVTSVSQQTQVTGTLPPDATVLIAEGGPTPGPGAAGTATSGGTTTTEAEQSQTTSSRWPLLIGILVLILILAWLGRRFFRKSTG